MNELMKKDALRYLYNEMTMEERELFEESLGGNPELMKLYTECKAVFDQLNPEAYSPSQESIDRILAYAKLGTTRSS